MKHCVAEVPSVEASAEPEGLIAKSGKAIAFSALLCKVRRALSPATNSIILSKEARVAEGRKSKSCCCTSLLKLPTPLAVSLRDNGGNPQDRLASLFRASLRDTKLVL